MEIRNLASTYERQGIFIPRADLQSGFFQLTGQPEAMAVQVLQSLPLTGFHEPGE
jgi:hypothetical protein